VGSRIVIIGAGQSGLQAAESLRTEGWNGELTLLGDEQQAPYHRPPLSKAYLLGDMVEAQLTMRDAAVFDRKQITLRTGNRVTQIDASARMVHVRHGEPLPYDHLVIATGARARVLQNVDMTGVHTLRSLDDACRIRAALAAATSIVVIGAGFIGLEFAAAATTMGKRVTMIE
jgi:3-phenylpropionate/trans-cinnamate dioxygenase ferredoxin reductase subunit